MMEVKGHQITCMSSAVMRVCYLDKILQYASPKLKLAIHGKFFNESLKGVNKNNRKTLSIKAQLSRSKIGKRDRKIFLRKQQKRVVVNIKRKPKRVIKYATHSCVNAALRKYRIRKPGEMLFFKRSLRICRKLKRRKGIKFDLRLKALREINRVAPKLLTSRLSGFPYIPDKSLFDIRPKRSKQQIKRRSSRQSRKKDKIKKSKPVVNMSQNLPRKRKKRKPRKKTKVCSKPMPLENWKITITKKQQEPSSPEPYGKEPEKIKVVEPCLSFHEYKTPTDRWNFLKAELPNIKTLNKKFPKQRLRSANALTDKIEKKEDIVEKYINIETERRLRESVYKTWEMTSVRRGGRVIPKIVPKIKKDNFDDSSLLEPSFYTNTKLGNNKKYQQQSNLLNEIIQLQTSGLHINEKPKTKKNKISYRSRKKPKRKKTKEPVHSEDLLVSVNRTTAFWFELTSRMKSPSTTFEKRTLESVPPDLKNASRKSSVYSVGSDKREDCEKTVNYSIKADSATPSYCKMSKVVDTLLSLRETEATAHTLGIKLSATEIDQGDSNFQVVIE